VFALRDAPEGEARLSSFRFVKLFWGKVSRFFRAIFRVFSHDNHEYFGNLKSTLSYIFSTIHATNPTISKAKEMPPIKSSNEFLFHFILMV